MLEIILSRIKARKENPILDKAKKDYQLQKKIYTGLDQEDIVTEYRKKESKNQKDQRNRPGTVQAGPGGNKVHTGGKERD
jgi:hypothetical protein